MHILHSFASITRVSFQNSAALAVFLPAFLASMNCLDSGNKMRRRPTPMEIPADKTVRSILLEQGSILLTCNPENCLPAVCRATNTEVGTGCKDIPQGVALLKDSRHETSGIYTETGQSVLHHRGDESLRAMLQGHRNGISIHTTHEQAEQAAHSQELLECPAVNRRDLQHAEDNHVEHHRPLTSVLVSS